MEMTNLCKEMECMYWKNDHRKSLGCDEFSTAHACPVKELKRVVSTQYEVGCLSSDLESVLPNARALCPDTRVRLSALGADPIKSMAKHRAHDRLSLDNRADRINEAIKSLRIGGSDGN